MSKAITLEQIESEAKRLFRIVNGPGDCGSEREYDCQITSGWERLARILLNERRGKIDSSDGPEKYLQNAARAAHAQLPDNHGFILVVSPFQFTPSDESGRAVYCSNVKREDAVAIIKTLLFRWGLNEEWMKEAR